MCNSKIIVCYKCIILHRGANVVKLLTDLTVCYDVFSHSLGFIKQDVYFNTQRCASDVKTLSGLNVYYNFILSQSLFHQVGRIF